MRHLITSLSAFDALLSAITANVRRRGRRLALALGFVWLILGSASANVAAEMLYLYVSPKGNDSWSGHQAVADSNSNGPLATITAARDMIRKLKAQQPKQPPIVVRLAGGGYHLEAPILFEPQDSGTAESPIRYESAPGDSAVLSGGREIPPFRLGDDGLWVTDVPGVAEGRWHFEQLWVNGRRATRAQTPNEFFHFMRDVVEEPIADGPGSKDRVRQTIFVDPADIQSLAGLKPEEINDVQLVAFRKLGTSRYFLSTTDVPVGALTMVGQASKSWQAIGRNTGYRLENYLAAVDSPGEWFLSRNGRLFYTPREGESLITTRAVAPVTDKLLVLRGEPEKNRWVEGITFSGLLFEHGQKLTPKAGFDATTLSVPAEALIMADGARQITFEDCHLGHAGGHGLWLRRGCVEDRVKHCSFTDLGAGGVRIGDTSLPKNSADRTERNVIENNIIRRCGQTFPGTAGVWIGHSGNNQVTHNEISDLYFTGISVGWTWGYAESVATENKIDFNHIHHLGWGYLGDLSGIYTLGPMPGTSLSRNVIHDIYVSQLGGWGINNSEGCSGATIENNLIYRTATGSYNLGYGRENAVRNNIFAFGGKSQIQRGRPEDHLSLSFDHNIVYFDTGSLFGGPWKAPGVKCSQNLYFDSRGQRIDFSGLNFTEWQAVGQDTGSRVADPKFAAPEGDDFHLHSVSPAREIDFHEFDYGQAGIYGDEAWRRLAASETYPAFKAPPAPPPLSLSDSFESTAVGGPPRMGKLTISGQGDSIAVTGEMCASGQRCLKITDASGQKESYMPTLIYNPGYKAGTVRAAFDLRVEEDATIEVEWRDESQPFRKGPKIRISDGKIHAADRPLMDLPEGEWLHVEMICGVGPELTGAWKLRVKVPGEALRVFDNLKIPDADFRNLDWLGFLSTSKDRTIAYIDNLELGLTAESTKIGSRLGPCALGNSVEVAWIRRRLSSWALEGKEATPPP
jgi:hypothetical protein